MPNDIKETNNMLIETVKMDTVPVPLPSRYPLQKKRSRYDQFFATLKVGQSFTCAYKASSSIRVGFINWRKKSKRKIQMVGRVIGNKEAFRFWVVDEKYVASN
jgi:hypothetical protein